MLKILKAICAINCAQSQITKRVLKHVNCEWMCDPHCTLHVMLYYRITNHHSIFCQVNLTNLTLRSGIKRNMVIPDPPYFPYYKILDEKIDFQNWWNQYALHHTDYLHKTASASELALLPYLLEAAPRRWYSRFVINMYTPLERATAKLFLRFSLDYESIILGSAFGMFLLFRHILDYHLSKSTQFRPGECVCSGRNTHLYLRWDKTHVNPAKFIAHDRKMFYRKFIRGIPQALFFGTTGALLCHIFFSQTFHCVQRHFPLFVGAIGITYGIYLNRKDYNKLDIHYNCYRHPELYGLALLMLYSVCRSFRNYSAYYPSRRVLIG